MNFSWAMDLDPKGANNQIKEAIDKRYLPDDEEPITQEEQISECYPYESGLYFATLCYSVRYFPWGVTSCLWVGRIPGLTSRAHCSARAPEVLHSWCNWKIHGGFGRGWMNWMLVKKSFDHVVDIKGKVMDEFCLNWEWITCSQIHHCGNSLQKGMARGSPFSLTCYYELQLQRSVDALWNGQT